MELGFPEERSNNERLRDNPDSNFFGHLNYSSDRYRDSIRQEVKERWLAFNKGVSRDPMTNERKHRQIVEEVTSKYEQYHREHRSRVILWAKSERVLNLLRSKGVTPIPTQDQLDQAMMRFVQTIQQYEFPEIDESAPQLGPNEYFELSRRHLVADYGYPFYSTVIDQPRHQDTLRADEEKIVGLNSDFWAAFLGGDKRLGHDWVFYVPESRIYFFDVVAGCYFPTSDDKVRLVLSQALQQRAWGQQPGLADTILTKFRTKKVFDEIIDKAKALLAAEAGFFHGLDARPKWGGVTMPRDMQVVVDSFVKDHVEQADGGIMTLGDCLLQLGRASAGSVGKKELTIKVNDAIRSTFNRGLRNDLRLSDDRVVAGWKGLRLRVKEETEENQDSKSSNVRVSGESDPSGNPPRPQSIALVSQSSCSSTVPVFGWRTID